jgi:hypothetical protein
MKDYYLKMTITHLFIIVCFLCGLYFYIQMNLPEDVKQEKEGFTSSQSTTAKSLSKKPSKQCPDMLIQKGAKFYLFNSRLAKVPGVNPIEFDHLEDYTEFLDWQHSQGIHCPVLYLQETYDAQGNQTYRIRPSVDEPQGGLNPTMLQQPNPTVLIDATHDDLPYNKQGYPAFDQSSFYVGATTPLDTMPNIGPNQPPAEKGGVSPDPMAPNWGGANYTQSLVDQGYYAGNEVQIQVP